MKVSINDKELKEYFEGLKRVIWGARDPGQGDEGGCESDLRAIRVALRKELFSADFAAFLQKYTKGKCKESFRDVLERFLNQSIELGTDAGSIVGVLQELGKDYAEINEPSGSSVLIRFDQINYVQAL